MEGDNNSFTGNNLISMNGGSGPLSYAKNSSYQKSAMDACKDMVAEAIFDNFEPKRLPSSLPFRIADLGCSTGPNTFIAMQNIIEAVEKKFESLGLKSDIPEFEVYFSDTVSNDFNTLFSSLPSDRRYFAVGVPGSFHGRLFPKASIHFVYSSYALHWLSTVPGNVLDTQSPAWSRDKIHYTSDANKVLEAYSNQFSKDMQAFLNARAQEVVPGGLMALLIAVVPDGTLPSQNFICLMYELLGSSLMDMARQGLLSEGKVLSFNLPIYLASPCELEDLVKRNGHFTVEKIIPMINQMKHNITIVDYKICIMHIRVGIEQLIKDHFGSEIIDDLFERFDHKVAAESSFIFKEEYLDNFVEQFVLLKREVTI